MTQTPSNIRPPKFNQEAFKFDLDSLAEFFDTGKAEEIFSSLQGGKSQVTAQGQIPEFLFRLTVFLYGEAYFQRLLSGLWYDQIKTASCKSKRTTDATFSKIGRSPRVPILAPHPAKSEN